MAKAELTIRITDAEAFRLFVWELRVLADQMRVEACPHRDALEHALDRLMDGDDEHGSAEDAEPRV
jgi:aminoglycoside phosphotransferase